MTHPVQINDETRAKGQRLVFLLANRFYMPYRDDYSISLGDFVGWGYQGLYEAYDRWNPAIAKFTVYAWYWVRYEIQRGIAQWKGYHRNSSQYIKDTVFEEFKDEATCLPTGSMQRDEINELRRNILMLPNYLYMVIVFRFYYELSNKEIEAITGIPSNEISSMIQTAIKMLRERYTTMEHVDKVNQVEQVEHKNDEGDKGDNSQSP